MRPNSRLRAILPCWRKSDWPSVCCLLFFNDLVCPAGIQRAGGGYQRVRQDQLGRMNCRKGERYITCLAVCNRHNIAFDTDDLAAQIAVPVSLLGESDLGLMPGPVGEVPRPGERPVEAGSAGL